MSTSEDAIAALRRSDEALCGQLSAGEPLGFATAYICPRFAGLVEANRLRDVWLTEIDAAAAFSRASALFAAQGAQCLRWEPAAAQPPEPIEQFLATQGWRRRDASAFVMVDWGAIENAGAFRRAGTGAGHLDPDGGGLRILPARAMRRAYRATFLDGSLGAEARAEVGLERLNDANYDAFVAMRGDSPAGRAAYFEVGDIARLTDVYVAPLHRRAGVGGGLVCHFLHLARRLLPRIIVADCPSNGGAVDAMLHSCGFRACGSLVRFDRD